MFKLMTCACNAGLSFSWHRSLNIWKHFRSVLNDRCDVPCGLCACEMKLHLCAIFHDAGSLYRLIELSTVNFVYFLFNTLSRKFALRNFIHLIRMHHSRNNWGKVQLCVIQHFQCIYCIRKVFPIHGVIGWIQL